MQLRSNWSRFRAKKGRFVWVGRKNVYKFYTKANFAKADRAMAAKHIADQPPFSIFENVLPKTVFRCPAFSFHKQKRIIAVGNINQLDRERQELVIATAAEAIPNGYPSRHWRNCISGPYLEQFLASLSSNQRGFIEAVTHDLFLPATGSHGDFGASNVLLDRHDQLIVIDWDSADQKGTFYTDAIRTFVLMNRVSDKKQNQADLRDMRLHSLSRLLQSNVQKLEDILQLPRDVIMAWHLITIGAKCFRVLTNQDMQKAKVRRLQEVIDQFRRDPTLRQDLI